MKQTQYAQGVRIAPTPGGAGETVSYRAEISLATADETLAQIIEMGPLPAGCELVDAILDSDDLDTGAEPAVTIDVGVMSGDFGVVDGARTCGAEIISAATVGQAGGVVRPTLATAFRIARSDVDRGIGVKLHAAPATAGAGKIGLTLIYRG